MDAQTQDSTLVSEKEQLPAPPGWTKKLVPASAKSITLRKYDVVFIAPDGQELKSKWHLTRYLKSHPDSPAISEFSWNSGEEAPIRRSSRFATKKTSEDDKSTSRRKGKRDAAEMEDDQEKASSRKRAKKSEKSEVSSEKQAAEEVEANVSEKDEVMHEAIAGDNETTLDSSPPDEVQKDGVDAPDEVQNDEGVNATVVEAVTEEAVDEGLDEQVKVAGSAGEQEDVQAKDEGLETLVAEEQINVSKDEGLGPLVVEEQTTVSSANIVGENEEINVTVVEEIISISDNGENTEHKGAQESGNTALAEDLKVEEASLETTVIESVELLDQEFVENEGDVSCKVTAVTSVVEVISEEEPLGPMVRQEEEPSETLTQKEEPAESLMQMEDVVEPPMQKEDPVEPLTQKEEQERPTHIQNSPQHMKDKSSSEFGSTAVPLGVANHQ